MKIAKRTKAGELLRLLRAQKGESVQEMADKLGVTKQRLSYKEIAGNGLASMAAKAARIYRLTEEQKREMMEACIIDEQNYLKAAIEKAIKKSPARLEKIKRDFAAR